MNVKKMFASLTGVLMLASAVTPMVTGAANYSDELKGAYEYAYSKNITTMSSIDGANMYGELTRGQLAKMIANWAEKENGTKVDETAVCSFADANTAEGDLATYVKKACQMGLMGQGVDNFRPNDKVTRGEFGTTLSRALWGDKYNGGTPFYVNHLNALKDAKIMNKIDTPNQMEIRGFVMLMLQRSAEVATPAECKDAAVILACALNGENCPAACKKNVEKVEDKVNSSDRPDAAGSLEVSVADKVAAVKSIPANGTATFGTLKLAAGSNEVRLYSVEVERFGLGERSDIKRVYFEKDGVRISGRAGLTSDGKATITFAPAFVVKANGSEMIDLVVNLDGVAGSEHAFKILSVDSTAKDLNVSEKETSTFRTTTYNVAAADVTYKGSNTTYKAKDSDNLEFGAFRIDNKANGKDITVKSLILRNDGNGDLTNLKNIAIYRDSTKVSKGEAMVNGKEMVVAVDSVIEGGKGANFYVRADVASVDNEKGDTYKLRFKNAEDLNIVETSTKFRTQISIPSGSMKEYTVEGGNVRFVRDASLSLTQNVAKGTDDVVMMKGKLTVKQAITLEDAKLSFASATDLKGKKTSDFIRKITLVVGGNQLNGSFDNKEVKFDGAVTVTKDADVELRVSFYSNFNQTPVVEFDKLQVSNFNVAEYVSNQNKVDNAIGSLPSVRATVVDAKLNASKSDGLNARTVVAGAKDEKVLGVKLSSQESQEITVSRIELEDISSNKIGDNLVTAELYVNDKSERSATLRSGKLSFDGLNLKVKKGQDVNLMVKADFDASIAKTKNLTLRLKASKTFATDYNGRDVELRSNIDSSTITISDGGSVNVATAANTPNAKLLAAGTKDVELGRFTLDAKDDTLRLTDIYLKAAVAALKIGDKVSNPRLYAGNDLVAQGQFFDGNGVLGFEDISSNNVIPASKTKEFRVVADINNGTTTAAYAQNLMKLQIADTYTNGTAGTVKGLRIVSDSNGGLVNVTQSNVMVGKENMLVRTALTAANAAGSNEISQTTAGVFTLTANGYKARVKAVDLTMTTNLQGKLQGQTAGTLEQQTITVANNVNIVAAMEKQKFQVTQNLGLEGSIVVKALGKDYTVAIAKNLSMQDVAEAIAAEIKKDDKVTVTTGVNFVEVEAKVHGDAVDPQYVTQIAGLLITPSVSTPGATDRGTITIKFEGKEVSVEVVHGQTANDVATNIKYALVANGVNATVLAAVVTLKAETPADIAEVTITPATLGGQTYTPATTTPGVAPVPGGPSDKIKVKIYKDTASGIALGEFDFDPAGAANFTVPVDVVEIQDGSNVKFYVTLEGTTIPANTTPNTELQLKNVKYDDMLDDGEKSVTAMSSYDQGLPLKWTNK